MIKLEYQKDATSPLVQFTSGQTMNQAQIVSVIRTFLEQCGFYKNKVNYSTPTPQEEWMPEHGQEEYRARNKSVLVTSTVTSGGTSRDGPPTTEDLIAASQGNGLSYRISVLEEKVEKLEFLKKHKHPCECDICKNGGE